MDQIDVDVQVGIPPDLVQDLLEDEPTEASIFEPDIDLPFTAVARRVLDSAEDFAGMIGGHAILTEHLLLAISATPECAASKLISEFRSSSDSLLTALEFIIGIGSPPPAATQPSPRLERVLIRAKREAYRMNHTHVNTLHLLMALIRERQGAACFVLDIPGYGLSKIERANVNAVQLGETD
jgi:ATP-dependent Clp protease ATP-binding subunit ClpC